MTDNTKMVDLPWHDGTTRIVPEGTIYVAETGQPYVAREDGYSYGIDRNAPWGETIQPHLTHSVAARIFTEAPEPPLPELPSEMTYRIVPGQGHTATNRQGIEMSKVADYAESMRQLIVGKDQSKFEVGTEFRILDRNNYVEYIAYKKSENCWNCENCTDPDGVFEIKTETEFLADFLDYCKEFVGGERVLVSIPDWVECYSEPDKPHVRYTK